MDPNIRNPNFMVGLYIRPKRLKITYSAMSFRLLYYVEPNMLNPSQVQPVGLGLKVFTARFWGVLGSHKGFDDHLRETAKPLAPHQKPWPLINPYTLNPKALKPEREPYADPATGVPRSAAVNFRACLVSERL